MNGRLLAAACLAALAIGCHKPEPEGFARFVPAAALARQSLSIGLDAWRSGHTAVPIDSVTPRIMLIDNRRQKGRKLERFEILGEFPADNARGFTARLTWAEPVAGEPALARYLVVGIDPLLIYRQEDLDMFCHWMHDMDDLAGDNAPKGSP